MALPITTAVLITVPEGALPGTATMMLNSSEAPTVNGPTAHSTVSDTPPSRAGAIEDFDCTMYFEIENDRVIESRYDGAGCQVIPRPGHSPGS